MTAGRAGIPVKDGGRVGWSEVRRERLEEEGKAEEATRSAEDVEGDSERWKRRKYGDDEWCSMIEEKWPYCAG